MVLKIFKMIATSVFLTALECTKFVFGGGLAPNPAGELTAFPSPPITGLRGLTSKRGGNGRKGRERENEGPSPLCKLLDPPLAITVDEKCMLVIVIRLCCKYNAMY